MSIERYRDLEEWAVQRADRRVDRIVMSSINSNLTSPEIKGPGESFVAQIEFRSMGWPPSNIRMGSSVRDARGDWHTGGGSNGGVTRQEIWRQLWIPMMLGRGHRGFRSVVVRAISPSMSGVIEVRRPEVFKAEDFEWMRDDKTPFAPGPRARNRHVKITGNGLFLWHDEPFVPIGCMVDHNLKSYAKYAKRGFNVNMWAASEHQAKKSVDAGLRFMLTVAPYIKRGAWAYGKWDQLRRWYSQVIERYGDHCLGFYYDHEAPGQWDDIEKGMNTVQGLNAGLPIYTLQGNYGAAGTFSAMEWTDCTGTYLRGENTAGASAGEGGHRVLWHDQEQRKPVTFAQINGRIQVEEMLADAGIWHTGMSFWRDGGRAGPIENRQIWDVLPDFAPAYESAVIRRAGLGEVEPDPTPPPPPTPSPEPTHKKVWAVRWSGFMDLEGAYDVEDSGVVQLGRMILYAGSRAEPEEREYTVHAFPTPKDGLLRGGLAPVPVGSDIGEAVAGAIDRKLNAIPDLDDVDKPASDWPKGAYDPVDKPRAAYDQEDRDLGSPSGDHRGD